MFLESEALDLGLIQLLHGGEGTFIVGLHRIILSFAQELSIDFQLVDGVVPDKPVKTSDFVAVTEHIG